MNTEDKIKVMQAYIDGKTIQMHRNLQDMWQDCVTPKWDWCNNRYRIKPEPFSGWVVFRERECIYIFDNMKSAKECMLPGDSIIKVREVQNE